MARMCAPGGPSASELSKEVGVSQPSLSRWIRQHGSVNSMNTPPRSPDQWSLPEQQQACLEYYKLPEAKRGAFLRSRGLKVADIERFEKEIAEALATSASPRRRGRPALDPEVKRLRKEVKEAQRELRIKDKALAETTARIVLLKKAEILFGKMYGDGEDKE